MVNTRRRRRSTGTSTTSTSTGSTLAYTGVSGSSLPSSAMSDMSTMTDGTGGAFTYDAPIGPSYRVPKEQYNLLKAHILKRARKTPAKKKKTTTKRRRRSYTVRRGGSNLNGMGPIVITGRGGYFTDKLKSGASAAYRALQRGLPEGTFARLGQAAGGAMFKGPGAQLGKMAGSGLASVLGFGDYAIAKNDLLRLDEGLQVPTFTDLNQGIVVSHREYIGDITQSTSWVNRTYSIQPGDPTTFPWLSRMAPLFDQYEVLGMLFQFRSTASDFGTTTNMAMGTLIMSTDYDTADAAYQSKIEMENAQYSISGKPSQDMIHAIECDPTLVGPSGLKWVRSGPVPSGKDIRLYDHGLFQLATTGMPAATGVIGELWVTYKIAFYKPQYNLGTDILSDLRTGTVGVSNTNPWPQTLNAANSIGTQLNGIQLIFPDKCAVGTTWLVSYFVFGASTAGVYLASFATSNVTVLHENSNPSSSTTTDRISVNAIIKITGAGTKYLGLNIALPTTITEAECFITQWDSDVV